MNRFETINAIKQRILDEKRKHSDEDWAFYAASKIYNTYVKNNKR